MGCEGEGLPRQRELDGPTQRVQGGRVHVGVDGAVGGDDQPVTGPGPRRQFVELRTTVSDAKAPCPLDRVNRQFSAQRPNQLWVSDFTYVSTWQGWLYVAFVVDVFARRIVGWRVSSFMRTDFVLDVLEQALYVGADRKLSQFCR